MNETAEKLEPDLSDHCSVCGHEVETVGQMDSTALMATGLPEPLVNILKAKSEEIQRHMSKPGGLGLPALLDKRRLQYGIVDEVFGIQAAFDRIFVYQIPARGAKSTYGDSKIIKTEMAVAREEFECPRGILVSAGLGALDVLASNGIALGHTVTLLRQSPWRMEMAEVAGERVKVLVLRAGDLSGSEDLGIALRRGDAEIIFQENEHVFLDPEGTPWAPTNPYISPEY